MPFIGIDLTDVLSGKMTLRSTAIAFKARSAISLVNQRFKLIRSSEKEPWELYDIETDRSESKNLAGTEPEIVQTMSKQLLDWDKSVRASARGKDYEALSSTRLKKRSLGSPRIDVNSFGYDTVGRKKEERSGPLR